ncbi:MAG: winged helix-turn-helix domain-containing protein [Nitrososphaerota archaeon]
MLEAIEQTSACRILILLLKEAYPVSEIIYKVGASQQAVYNALRKLKDAGLIQEELEKEFPRRRLISLTDKGRKVAEKLEEIERLLSK